jgi:hypothetical protein
MHLPPPPLPAQPHQPVDCGLSLPILGAGNIAANRRDTALIITGRVNIGHAGVEDKRTQ